MQHRRAKFRRQPEHLTTWRLTACDIAILAAVHRYGLLTSSLLVRIVDQFNEDVVYRHARNLFDRSLVNRFVQPTAGAPGEFIYYLDNPRAIDVLIEFGGMDPAELDRESVWRNREKAYHELLDPKKAISRQGSTMFISHELTLTRFHSLLELACRKTNGRVVLAEWRQGAQLWSKVTMPKFIYDEKRGRWLSDTDKETLPHRPDAFFTLHFPGNQEHEQRANFFYEADRGTMSAPEAMRRKFRTYFEFVVRQKNHRQKFGIQRIRAVLVEAIDGRRARRLFEEAQHASVCGGQPSPLFWFTASELFTKKEVATDGTPTVPLYLRQPELVLDKIWIPSIPRPSKHSLLD